MLQPTKPYLHLVSLCFCLSITSCISLEYVRFKTPIDTSNRTIEKQVKQTFHLESLGIYASNEFAAARLNGFKKKNDSTVLVIIRPENEPINHSPYYAFSTWSDNPRSIYFSFQYPPEYEHRYLPKLKTSTEWQEIDKSLISTDEELFTFKLNLKQSPTFVAAQEIQDAEAVTKWYTELAAGKEDFVHIKSAGSSLQGNDLPVLDIYKGDKAQKELVVLLTRQHPPEVTGYFAFQQFLSTILDESELSDQFLNKYRVLAFPLINPDGVDMGHWRHNAGGVDTNRDWSSYQQKEVRNIVRFITKTVQKDQLKIILGLDFHSTYEDVFYTNKERSNTTLPHFIEDWFAALEQNIPNYKVNEKAGNSTKPVSKGWFLYGHDAVGITYEIGDETPKAQIELIGEVSAQEMMKLLVLTKK